MKYFYFLIVLVVVQFVSCRTAQPVVTATQNDSTHISSRIDSTLIFEKDSVAMSYHPQAPAPVSTPPINDSPAIADMPQPAVPQVRVDTLIIEKWRVRYRDRTVQHTDTVFVDVEKHIEKPPERYIPGFYKWCTWSFVAVLVLLILYIVLRVVIKIYARK